jgi:hypothetical protein
MDHFIVRGEISIVLVREDCFKDFMWIFSTEWSRWLTNTVVDSMENWNFVEPARMAQLDNWEEIQPCAGVTLA